jgi:tetratricopeptide (TPR) repeat protein
VRTAAAAFVALLLAISCAFAQEKPAGDAKDDPKSDPLEPLKPAMDEQDKLLDQGKAEAAVAAARERAKDGTPESLYLLGRALGNHAVKLAEGDRKEEGNKLLDQAREAFEKSKEAGGLLYAPAHLGLARVDRFKGDVDGAVTELRQALRISKNFKAAALELAQSLWQKDLANDAEYVLYQFLGERPNDAEAHLLLGLFKLQRKRFAEAEPEFRGVLSADPQNAAARKLLAADLMYQEKYEESAEHFEMVRKATPKDDEAYTMLFNIYKHLKKKPEAVAVLNDLAAELPGTEHARLAKSRLKELADNPELWNTPDEDTPEALVERLKSKDQDVVLKTLERMRAFRWPALPADVYRFLLKDEGTAAIRLASVRLIGDLADPQTLTILEILLLHPVEREQDATTRAEVAHAMSRLKTDAIVPMLFEVLDDPDADVREWAVQGIAARTGKWFRADLTKRTEVKDWPAELDLYRRWWASSSSSLTKRNAALAMGELYGRVEKGSKARVARYALPAMDDANEATWRAGYDLFRTLTFETFGSDKGPADAAERQRIAQAARKWLDDQARPTAQSAPATTEKK